MLGGLDAYGSDDSDSEETQQSIQPHTTSESKKSLLLPPTKPPSLQPPKTKSKRPIFTVARPSKAGSDDNDDSQERPTKKPKVESRKGAGSSSLLAMLPAPSKARPVPPPRVLGSAAQGGGGTGVAIRSFSVDDSTSEETAGSRTDSIGETEAKSTTLVPLSLAKGKTKPSAFSKETHSTPPVLAVDFFSLGTAASFPTPSLSTSKISTSSEQNSAPVSITSAPVVPVFEPPTPTASDPYPGYYQLPSGQWAAHDPEFYKKHYESWFASPNLDGTAQKGFEGAEGEGTIEVDAQTQLDLARKERDEKKALTANAGGGPSAPKMNIKPPKIGSRARTRHQLSALLTEAYENRETLEEKIAQGRRNRKEAGNKYGF